MSRIRFDQLAKQYLEGCFEPLGHVERQFEVPGEPKFVDVWFTPTPMGGTEPPEQFGLLNRLAQTACLLEPFRSPPTRSEIRSSLLKLLWIQDEQRRRVEQERRSVREEELPRLWILAASISEPMVQELGGQLQAEWGNGIYFLSGFFKTAIVAINELPETEETLWLRILGSGRVQKRAIGELLDLPTDDPRRARVLKLLVSWRVMIEMNELVLEGEGEELMAALSQAYLQWEETTKQVGRREGEQRLLLQLLNQKFSGLPDRLAQRINTLNVEQLERLAVSLLGFTTIADLETWLGQPENQPIQNSSSGL